MWLGDLYRTVDPSKLRFGDPYRAVDPFKLQLGDPCRTVSPSKLQLGDPYRTVSPSKLQLGDPYRTVSPSKLRFGDPYSSVSPSKLRFGDPYRTVSPSKLRFGGPYRALKQDYFQLFKQFNYKTNFKTKKTKTMGISRRLPNSEATRALALDRAALKISISPPGDIVLSAQTQARLATIRTALNTNLALRGQALGNQMGMTPDKDNKRRKAGLFVSHFVMGCDKAALRGEPGFTLSDRTFFQLDGSNDALPPLETDDEVFLWGSRIIAGNALRLAAGKPAMPFPLIADVNTKYTDFTTVFGDYNLLKRAYDDAQEAISGMRPEVDSLILRIWNEVEAAYSEEDAESKRRNSREWGVVYVLTGNEAPSPAEFSIMGTIADSASGLPIEDVEVSVMPGGSVVLTDSLGRYYVPVLAAGSYDVTVHKAGYLDKTIPGVIVTAGAITTLNATLASTAGTGTISGNVNAPGFPTATVSVAGTGLTATTDPMGNYTISNVPIGMQTVQCFLNSDPANIKTQTPTVVAGATVTVNFSFP